MQFPFFQQSIQIIIVHVAKNVNEKRIAQLISNFLKLSVLGYCFEINK